MLPLRRDVAPRGLRFFVTRLLSAGKPPLQLAAKKEQPAGSCLLRGVYGADTMIDHRFVSTAPLLRSFVCTLLLVCGSIAASDAQEAVNRLSEVVVEAEAEAEGEERVQGPFLPPVQGTRINAGKKTSVIDLDELPRITNNNYRQALAQTPGLFLSEETSPLISIGYRGLNPHRAQFTQVLKDGIPIHADQFGYPEAYYSPPLDTVDRIEFLRGGAALMYGPQPGGALNYITHRPRLDRPFSFGTTNTFGSDNYFSNFTYVDGTSGRLGYYGYYNHRESDGFRTSNSAFNLNAGNVKLVLDATSDSRWILSLEAYEEQHGEPGGLTFATGTNAVNYLENRHAASRLYDLFELERYFASLAWEKDFTETTKLTMTAWGGYYSRYSSRQRGGGFGTRPTGAAANTTSNEHQEFYTQGFEARLRHDYDLFGGTHTIAGGFQAYHTDSPREDRRGQTFNDRDGLLRNDSDREVWYLPLFVENRFKFGPLSITPGVRLENIWQGITENVNVDKAAARTPLADEDDYEFVPLFGIGVAYEMASATELYGNVSQSYRPKVFTQAVPTGGTTLVPEDLRESTAWQYEIGFRGRPQPWVSWDVSGFLLDFDDQIGTVALPGGRSTLGNVGGAHHYGIEASGELDVLGLLTSSRRTLTPATPGKGMAEPAAEAASPYGSLSLYGNITLLDAEFVSGPRKGNTPAYAPDYLLRTGAIYRWGDRVEIAMLGTIVDQSFSDDGNRPDRAVPAYVVWDLTAEVKVYKDIVSVNAGINNLFNEDYYARVRDDGIDPAPRRNYYGGVSLTF
ncbi:MAG: TonB-dependent receptor [Verrucomicrobiota bacterium]|nr:TonB-dependent receptor [Verrucomicrobiota bacterium]